MPHDWSIEGPYDEKAPAGGPGGYLPMGIGWYRKSFTLPDGGPGHRVSVQFDGVYQHSTVWVNGHEAGTRPYGYASFIYDITPYLNPEGTPNIVAVRVDNSQQPNSRWYTGSGIFRHTWLTVTDALHFAPWGITITTPDASEQTAVVKVVARVHNSGASSQDFQLRARIVSDPESLPAGAAAPTTNPEVTGTTTNVASGAEAESEASLTLTAPRLWSPSSPSLYTVRAEVVVGGIVVDATDTTIGVRTLTFDVNRGLLINGEPVKVRGVCLHHDGGAVGAAVPRAVLERRLRLLQEMGCNAIRCSHNPMDPALYDLCDQLGILVMDESFDEWTIRKPQITSGYSDIFEAWYERDVTDLVRRDRNHPSIFIWNAGNEIGEQQDPRGPGIAHRLVQVFHREDPTRPVTVAMDNVFNQLGNAPLAFTDEFDVVGYNYVDRWGTRRETQYGDDRFAFPKRKFIGTEETGVAVTRGVYQFGSLLDDNDSDDHLVLGKGPAGALYVASTIRAASLWRFLATHDYAIGQFVWTGFDYLGESKWPLKLTSFGALDTCGFKKDSFYFYQSIWTDKPMVHLLPHWNWSESQTGVIPVVAYSNCPAVELFVNGKSFGVKSHEFPSEGVTEAWNHYALPKVEATTADMQLVWDVPYAPGEVKAVGYDRTGNVVVQTVIRTAGQPAKLEITADRSSISAGTRDVASLTVRALDSEGVPVPLASNQITFSVAGPAKIIGVDNGDPNSHESYQGNTRSLFNGMALALLQSTPESGSVTITAKAEGLESAQVTISTAASRL